MTVPAIDGVINGFVKLLTHYSDDEQALIDKAISFAAQMHAGQLRASGEPYFTHPLGVAKILVEMRMDSATIIAALLHDVVEDTEISLAQVEQIFGHEVALLVDGVTKITLEDVKDKNEQDIATLQKLFVAMTNDIRVVLLKLADKLHNMETLAFKKPEKQQKTAKECLNIYVPLASKLGIWWLKRRLEDLALEYIDNEKFKEIKAFCLSKEAEQEQWANEVKVKLLAQSDKIQDIIFIKRNYYAVYRSYLAGGFKGLSYPFGIRIICNDNLSCYTALAYVHRLCKPIDGLFRDYIANHKENEYRALHSVVVDNSGNKLSIEILSKEMYHLAEYGILAIWLFDMPHFIAEDINLIERIKERLPLNLSSSQFINDIKKEVFEVLFNVFDAKGKSYAVNNGTTALDFAFKVAREQAIFIKKIIVDDKERSLDYPLKNQQLIQFTKQQKAAINLSWLNYTTNSTSHIFIKKYYQQKGYEVISAKDYFAALPSNLTHIADYHLARCCRLYNGELLAGLLTSKKGMELHNPNCAAVKRAKITYEVAKQQAALHQIRVQAEINDSKKLFAKVEELAAKEGLILKEAKTNLKQGRLTAGFTIQAVQPKKLEHFITLLSKLDMIDYVTRKP
ncbi:MAG: HD domain-containing protein [Spirochaetaceae bacterium]|nr:HD domain-containing protein [Spirochaetaceae bacterium]